MKYFELNRPLDKHSHNDPEDVRNAKTALYLMGLYRPPEWGITPYPDLPLFKGVREFQSLNGLRSDGVMKPGGETERMFQNFAQKASGRGSSPNTPSLQIDANAPTGIRITPRESKTELSPDDAPGNEAKSKSQPCPHMQLQVKRKNCLPYTKLCWDEVSCVPGPVGGKR